MAPFDQIAERHGAALLLQYGSTVSGPTHARSDVDVGVLFDAPPPSLFDLGGLIGDLEERFPGPTVDLAVPDHADPLFLHRVVQRWLDRVLAERGR